MSKITTSKTSVFGVTTIGHGNGSTVPMYPTPAVTSGQSIERAAALAARVYAQGQCWRERLAWMAQVGKLSMATPPINARAGSDSPSTIPCLFSRPCSGSRTLSNSKQPFFLDVRSENRTTCSASGISRDCMRQNCDNG